MDLIPDKTGPEKKWPLNAEGVIGSKMANYAIELKGLVQRDMASRTIEEANRLCDAIISEAERVEEMENAVLIGGFSA